MPTRRREDSHTAYQTPATNAVPGSLKGKRLLVGVPHRHPHSQAALLDQPYHVLGGAAYLRKRSINQMRKRWPIGVLVMGVIALQIGIYLVLDVPDPVRAVRYPDARVPVSAAVELSVGEVRGRLQRRFEEDSVFGASPQPWPNLEGFGPAYGPQLHSFSVEDNADGGPEGRFERAADGLNPRVIDPGLPAYLAHPPRRAAA